MRHGRDSGDRGHQLRDVRMGSPADYMMDEEAELNWIRDWIDSQWSSYRADVMWSRGSRFIAKRAATLSALCRGAKVDAGRLARIALH